MMKRIFLLFVTLLSLAVCISCSKVGASTPEAHEISFLPGECLKSTELTHHLFEYNANVFDQPFVINSGHNAKGELELNCMTFAFEMDLDAEKESFSDFIASDYRYHPSQSVFSSFGKDSGMVMNGYETVYESITKSPNWLGGGINSTTIYYNGGLVITSTEEFAGIPAGENLASVAHVYLDPYAYSAFSLIDLLSVVGIPDNYAPLGRLIVIRIPTDGYQLADWAAKIHIEIPVKVGLFLNYLKDKETNPAATMQFRDEVLTCDFTTSKILK